MGTLIAIPLVVVGAMKAVQFVHWLSHPDALSCCSGHVVSYEPVGITVGLPMSAAPWGPDNGVAHVRSVRPVVIGTLPAGARVSLWRCDAATVGGGGEPLFATGKVADWCGNPRPAKGSFDLDLRPGSSESLVAAITSPTPGWVSVQGITVTYKIGLQSGAEHSGLTGQFLFGDKAEPPPGYMDSGPWLPEQS